MISAFTGRKVRKAIAMTGEITLRGNVLPVGGLKEKVLAARRYGIHKLVIPAVNGKNLDEIPKSIRRELEFVLVRDIRDVLEHALEPVAGTVELRRPRKGSRSSVETAH
jgi:ATP-dependent Lon protease